MSLLAAEHTENGVIELQGDHTKKIKDILVKLGFDKESID